MISTRFAIHTVVGLILVGAPGSSVLASPAVNGNTISWPDDGWYQVQTADGAESICNGTRDCAVDDGLYLVIDHTRGI